MGIRIIQVPRKQYSHPNNKLRSFSIFIFLSSQEPNRIINDKQHSHKTIFSLTPGVKDKVWTDPGSGQALDNNFLASVPRIIQRKIILPIRSLAIKFFQMLDFFFEKNLSPFFFLVFVFSIISGTKQSHTPVAAWPFNKNKRA